MASRAATLSSSPARWSSSRARMSRRCAGLPAPTPWRLSRTRPRTSWPRPGPTANCPATSPTTTPKSPTAHPNPSAEPAPTQAQARYRQTARSLEVTPCRPPLRRTSREQDNIPWNRNWQAPPPWSPGASSSIGAATARRLAGHGACVALVARRRDRLEALAAEIGQAGGTALAVEADITDRTQAEAAVQQAAGRFGRLDTLVNNAGLMLLGAVAGADPQEWDRMIAINI